MLPGELSTVFGPLSIGLYVIIGTFMILWSLHPTLNYLKSILSWFPDNHIAVVFSLTMLFAYGFGLIVQDFTDYMTDSVETSLSAPSLTHLMKDEGELRFNTLFKKEKTTSSEYQLTHLGRELFSSSEQFFHQFLKDNIENNLTFSQCDFKNTGDKLLILLNMTCPKCDNETILHRENSCLVIPKKQNLGKEFNNIQFVQQLVNKTYYFAKNWAFTKNNYFNELQIIQRRIDFARSTFLISVALSSLACLFLLFKTLILMTSLLPLKILNKNLYLPRLVNAGVWKNNSTARIYTGILLLLSILIGVGLYMIYSLQSDYEASKYVMITVGLTIIASKLFLKLNKTGLLPKLYLKKAFYPFAPLIAILIIGRIALGGYWEAEHVFNERAFGYFSSMLERNQFMKNKSGDSMTINFK